MLPLACTSKLYVSEMYNLLSLSNEFLNEWKSPARCVILTPQTYYHCSKWLSQSITYWFVCHNYLTYIPTKQYYTLSVHDMYF